MECRLKFRILINKGDFRRRGKEHLYGFFLLYQRLQPELKLDLPYNKIQS